MGNGQTDDENWKKIIIFVVKPLINDSINRY